MTTITIIMAAIALCMFIAAVITDIKTKKIPNIITLPCIGAGLGLLTAESIMYGSYRGLIVAVIVSVVLFLMSALKLMGAGDIKLLIGTTLLSGPVTMAATAGAGSLFVLVYFLIRHFHPTVSDMRVGLTAMKTKNLNIIDRDGTKVIFAPFMAIGFIIFEVIKIIFYKTLWI